jgi:hypothetical protein
MPKCSIQTPNRRSRAGKKFNINKTKHQQKKRNQHPQETQTTASIAKNHPFALVLRAQPKQSPHELASSDPTTLVLALVLLKLIYLALGAISQQIQPIDLGSGSSRQKAFVVEGSEEAEEAMGFWIRHHETLGWMD